VTILWAADAILASVTGAIAAGAAGAVDGTEAAIFVSIARPIATSRTSAAIRGAQRTRLIGSTDTVTTEGRALVGVGAAASESGGDDEQPEAEL